MKKLQEKLLEEREEACEQSPPTKKPKILKSKQDLCYFHNILLFLLLETPLKRTYKKKQKETGKIIVIGGAVAITDHQQPAAVTDDQQPAAVTDYQQPPAVTGDQQPPAVTDDQPAAAFDISADISDSGKLHSRLRCLFHTCYNSGLYFSPMQIPYS